jgi:hypothetical protein
MGIQSNVVSMEDDTIPRCEPTRNVGLSLSLSFSLSFVSCLFVFLSLLAFCLLYLVFVFCLYLFLNKTNKTEIYRCLFGIPVVCSVVPEQEAEYAGLFAAARIADTERRILHNLGYPQGPTSIYCDNECAVGLASVE